MPRKVAPPQALWIPDIAVDLDLLEALEREALGEFLKLFVFFLGCIAIGYLGAQALRL